MKTILRLSNILDALGDWSSQSRIMILVFFLFYRVAIHASNGLWYGDFWEHSAVVEALIKDPTHPSHPLFALDAPHAFISPYHWVLAKLANVFKLTPIDVLAVAGLANFGLLIVGLRLYVDKITPNQSAIASFYALLFILFLWGSNPWGFSGFLHFQLLADVLPYSSTFATALSLIGLGLGSGLKPEHEFDDEQTSTIFDKLSKRLLLSLICTVVLLSHPLTFVFLSTGLLCQAVMSQRPIKAIIQAIVPLALAGLIALCWPYYSILALLLGAGDVYHASNQSMYADIFTRLWPVLLLSPLVLPAIKDHAVRSTLLHLLMLIGIYIFGWVTGKYSYGRDITFIVILAQILIARQVATFELNQFIIRPALVKTYRIGFMLVLLGLAAHSWLYPTLRRSLTVMNSIVSGRPISNQQMYKNLTFLPDYVQHDQIVLSDLDTSWMVPSFGAKVVAALHAQAFIADDEQRRLDLSEFFTESTTSYQRQALLQKYKPDYLLLNKQATLWWPSLIKAIASMTPIKQLYENDQYVLWSLH